MLRRLLKRSAKRLRFHLATMLFKSYFFKPKSGSYRRIFHRGTIADLGVLEQIFLQKDYSLNRLVD